MTVPLFEHLSVGSRGIPNRVSLETRERKNTLVLAKLTQIESHIVQPYQEGEFTPLNRWRGGLPIGRIKSLYNWFCVGMELEIPTVSMLSTWSTDCVRPSALAHLSGLHSQQTPRIAFDAMGTRLLESRDILKRTPHLEEYLRFLRDEGGMKIYTLRDILKYLPTVPPVQIKTSWPFVNEYTPQNISGMDVIEKIDGFVPKSLPSGMRDDICQDLTVEVLLGNVKVNNIPDVLPQQLKKFFKAYPTKYGGLSLDAKPKWDEEGRTLLEVIQPHSHTYQISGSLCEECDSYSEELQDRLCPTCYKALEQKVIGMKIMADYKESLYKGDHRASRSPIGKPVVIDERIADMRDDNDREGHHRMHHTKRTLPPIYEEHEILGGNGSFRKEKGKAYGDGLEPVYSYGSKTVGVRGSNAHAKLARTNRFTRVDKRLVP